MPTLDRMRHRSRIRAKIKSNHFYYNAGNSNSRQLVREQLSAYGPGKTNRIPYKDKYRQYITVERGCTAKYAHACIYHLNSFINFSEQTYNLYAFDPFNVEPYRIRRYMMYLKNDFGNKPKTRNHKVNAIWVLYTNNIRNSSYYA